MCATATRRPEPPGNVNLFQEMLELIQDLSGVRTVIYDRTHFTERAGRAEIDTALSGHRSGFCRGVRVSRQGDRACVACDVDEMTVEAAKRRRPFLHDCHAGLREVVFPVLYRAEHVATVFCGQAAVDGCPAENGAWLARRAKKLGVPPQTLKREYKRLPRVSAERLLKIGEMLFGALNYLAEQEGRAGIERTLALYRHPPVRSAIAFVDERFGEPIGLSDAARHCRVVPEHLSRLFHRVVGMTFSEYLTRRRIECAQELLRTTSLDMTSIATQCGYAHQSYFGRKFKQSTGMTPLQYRAKGALSTE